MSRDSQDLIPLRLWVHEPLAPDVAAALARLQATDDVRRIAVMPDVHLAHEVCVGTVVATSGILLPQAVGSDLGCGMAAVGFECQADLLGGEEAAARVLAGLYESVPVMRHADRQLPVQLMDQPLSDPRLEKLKTRDGRVQFGTLGRGNHFLEFQADDTDRLWVMVHTGSRGVGQAIASHHLRAASWTNTALRCLHIGTVQADAYLNDLSWALNYADENRRAILDSTIELMRRRFGVGVLEEPNLHCCHNHVRQEEHNGERLWVHRKGAISACPGEPGIIPGSMGSYSFQVEGRGCRESLMSSSHGAGRAMSRSEARRRVSVKRLSLQLRGVWYDHRVRNALCEEGPDAYKDIEAVMRAQKDLTRVVRRLRPILSYKGA